MPQILFSPDWLNHLSDPYAVLGVAVSADENRVLKRYREIAKFLHPDRLVTADPATREAATQLFAKLVNPAYQRLKQEKERANTLATLRIRIRQLNRDDAFMPNGSIAQKLLKLPVHSIDIFYEQSVAELSRIQYQDFGQFDAVTQQLADLNLTYLHLKMGAPVIREKRTGIVAVPQAKPVQFAPSPNETVEVAVNYAQRHYYRAQEYAKKANWMQVVAELRDAIRLEPDRSEYHSLLAKAYLMQNLSGMAKVHFRQALKFNPKDPLALQYAQHMNLQPVKPKTQHNGLFSLFTRRR